MSVRSVTTPLEQEPVWQDLALEIAGIGVWEWDFVAGQGQWSKGLCSILGLASDGCALGPDGILHVVHPDDQVRYRASIHSAFEGASDHNLEYRILLPHKRVRWILDRARVIRNDDGEPIRMVGALTDVTERKHEEIARRELERSANARLAAERALRETEHRLEAILDNAPAAVYVKDLEGNLKFVNNQFVKIFNLPREMIIDNGVDVMHPPHVLAKLRDHDRIVLEAGEPLQFEEEIILRGDQKTYLSVKFPLRDEGGDIYALCGISTDITDRKHAEQVLELRSQELQQVIEELNQFTYSVSHDMSSPLRGVIGNVRFLREELGEHLNDSVDARLRRIEMAALKMGHLVDDLLSFSRLGRQEMKIESVELNDLLDRLLRNLKWRDGSYREASIEMEEGIVLEGDSEFIGMALAALVANSVKYRKPGEQARLRIGSIESGFFVKDEGIGIDMEYVHKIFQPFERLHRDVEYPGTGIGLAKVQRIVDRHGGKVWVESALGEGATFFVRLKA